MIGPPPEIGAVIRYSYLWLRQAQNRQIEGEKDRPCAVVASVRVEGGETIVQVLPISTRRPDKEDLAVELTNAARQRLGLEADASWIIISESNEFMWPGPDVRPVPRKLPPTIAYGHLTRLTLQRMAQAYVNAVRSGMHIRMKRKN